MKKKRIWRKAAAVLLLASCLAALMTQQGMHTGDREEEAFADSSVSLTAVLTRDAAGTSPDQELTPQGSTVTGWDYDTSRFLQVSLSGETMEKDYRIVVEMAPQIYANVTSVPDPPSGFGEVIYTENTPLTVNEGKGTYIHAHSGTYEYIVNEGTKTASLTLELRYDNAFWNMTQGASLNTGSDPLVRIYLVEVQTEDDGTENRQQVTLPNGSEFLLKQVVTGIARSTAPSSLVFREGELGEYTLYGTLGGFDSSMQAVVLLLPMHNLGYQDGHYFDELDVTVTAPHITVSGTTYYMEIDRVLAKTSSGVLELKQTASIQGQATCSMEDVHFSGHYGFSRGMVEVYFKFPSNLSGGKAVKEYAFTNGAVQVTATQNGMEKDIVGGDCNNSSWNKIGFVYEDNPPPNVGVKTGGFNADYSETNLKHFGQIALYNTGGDSGKVIYKVEFEGDTNAIKVTDIMIMASTGPKEGASESGVDYSKIPVTYTLEDAGGKLIENGKKYTVYLENPYYGKTAEDNMCVMLDQSYLPEEYKNYYFKTIEYPIYNIEKNIYLYEQNSAFARNSGGNFWGWTNASEDTDVEIKYQTAYADGTLIKNSTYTLHLKNEDDPPYYIQNFKISDSSIFAGESVGVEGEVFVNGYPYSYQQYLERIRIAIVLPGDVEINRSSFQWYFENDREVRRQVESVEKTPLNDGTNRMLWTIVFDSSAQIGWYNGNLNPWGKGSYIHFSFQLDTNEEASNQTIDFRTDFYAAGIGQINGSSGSASKFRKIDIYDLNKNNSKVDYVGGIDSALSTDKSTIEIRSLAVALDISDRFTTEEDTGRTVSLTDAGYGFTYDLTLASKAGGDATDFYHFIPIPKAGHRIQRNFITKKQLEFAMTGPVEVTEDMAENPIRIWYTTDVCSYAQAAAQEKEGGDTITWYESLPAGKTWEDVTMIRLKYSEDIIYNGSRTSLSVPLICDIDEEEFIISAGMETAFQSRGYHCYLRDNVTRYEGEASTEGVSLYLQYDVDPQELTLTAAKNETPQGSGAVNVKTLSGLPAFKVAKNYQIASVECYNVTLKSSGYMEENRETLKSSQANREFAVTVQFADGSETDIAEGNHVNIPLGSGENGVAPEFTFRLHNANALSDVSTVRYIDVLITGDNGATIPVRINIAREFSQIVTEDSFIQAGKRYVLTDGDERETVISRDSACTAQFIMNDVIPNTVTSRTLVLDRAPAAGTTILMIDWTDQEAPVYGYYTYADSDETTELRLDDFTLLGGTEKYRQDTTGETAVKEQYLFVFDHCGCGVPEETGERTMMLQYLVNGSTYGEELVYRTDTQRTFELSAEPSEVSMGKSFKVSYAGILEGAGPDSRFDGRKLSLVIRAKEGEAFPAETVLYAGGVGYGLDQDGRFVIPLGNVQGDGGEVTMSLMAASLAKLSSETEVGLQMELWASATANGSSPFLGEKVAETTTVQVVRAWPSLRIDSMLTGGEAGRIVQISSLSEPLVVQFSQMELDDRKVTAELQKKAGAGYVTLTGQIETVDDIFQHVSGVYTIDMEKQTDGSLNFNLKGDFEPGTYRIMLCVYDEKEKKLLQVPYNFILVEDQQ